MRLRASLAAIAISATAGATSQALAASPIHWKGSTQLTFASAGCASNSAIVRGAMFLATFNSKVAPSDDRSSLLFSLPQGSVMGTTTSTAYPSPWSGTYDGIVVNADATGRTYTGGNYYFTATPSQVFATTQKVEIKGNITMFAGIAGCNIKFQGTFYRVY